MKTFKAILIASALVFGVVSVADAKSRVSSSSRSSYSSSRSYSSPKSYAAPKAAAPSKPTMKSLGFGKPASTQTASRPTASVSPSKTTTSGGWFSRKNVSSSPATSYKAPPRKVSSPSQYRSQPQRNVTVIQRNYYGGNNGYSRGYNSGNYGYGGGYYGRSGGGMGDAFIGAMGGMMVYNALFNNHGSSHSGGGASAAQIEQAKQDQRIEDKLDRVLDQQGQPVGVAPIVAAPVVAQPQCYLPEDAPLMMSPSFYCQPQNSR